MHIQCLIVDDEQPLANSTMEYFNLFGVTTHAVYDGDACLEYLKHHTIDVLLLDVNLQETTGFLLCKTIREQYNFPILFISARGSDDDILMGLHVGGDDYIAKPYTLSVLLAKVQAILKRCLKSENKILKIGEIMIDEINAKVYVRNQEVEFPLMEYNLLKYMMLHPNCLLRKEALFENVWGSTITQDGTLNVHIRHLREKIEFDPTQPQYIKTVWGSGYRFEDSNT